MIFRLDLQSITHLSNIANTFEDFFNARRTDVIVDYRGEQFIVELKIWHGNEYNERGEEQLMDYLDYYHKDRGYMLSFNLRLKIIIPRAIDNRL